MRVKKNLVISGTGENHQVYKYVGTDGCYFRDVSSKDYTIVSDSSDDSCLKRSRDVGSGFPSRLSRRSVDQTVQVDS
jgi:hypothetical protein